MYDHIVDGIRIRNKCECYEHGEKSTKFFLNLKKKWGVQKGIRKLIVEEKEIVGDKEISNNIKTLYKTFKGNFSQKPMLKNNNSIIL